MRHPPSTPFAILVAALVLGAAPRSQEPPEQPGAEQAERPAAAPVNETPPRRVVAVRAGTVHPVAGGAIDDAVVVIEDGRITAIGPAASVTIPDGATVLDHRGAHVYPGLVDALTDAFTDQGVREDGSLDAAAAVKDALAERGDREDEVVRSGITTAYVAARSGAAWRGQGAVVHPLADGFALVDGKAAAAVELRATNGPQPSHALQRQQQVQGLFAAFEGLEQYRTSFTEHDKALETYQKQFAEYLAFHEKKKGGTDGGDGSTRPRAGTAGPGEGGPPAGGRRRRGEGRANPPAPGPTPEPPAPSPDPAPQPKPEGKEPPQPPEAQGQGRPGDAAPAGATAPAPAAEPKPPERPKYPKEPPRDPVKDALLDVLDGKLPLRVEAHREDEILAVLRQADDRKVPLVVLENPFGGASLADRLARAGVPVVLGGVWPRPLPVAYEGMDPVALPAELERHGVAFALASGGARRSDALPLMAACAVGAGLPEAAALRAITLTPAEILGVQRDVGSLQVGKRGDLLVTDRPLFASDCKVLRVVSGGETQFEAR